MFLVAEQNHISEDVIKLFHYSGTDSDNRLIFFLSLFQGGMFNYISGANFFGESVEWMGYALACWHLPAFAFAIFTVCNIGPRAFHHHK